MTDRLRIIVGGMVARYPLGGVAWDYLQYVIGFARLGHDVHYHEDTWSWPYHPREATCTSDGSYSARFIADFFAAYAPELAGRWHYQHLQDQHFGMGERAFDQVARSADLFVNVSGACAIPAGLNERATRVFLDTDPGYNQIVLAERSGWSDDAGQWAISGHDRFFTYAENIGGADCGIPRTAFTWRTTRMPVVTELWAGLAPATGGAPWTTVMTWNAFSRPVVYQGVEYRGKDLEFERLIGLPSRVPVHLKVAVGGVGAPHARLRRHGWEAVDGPGSTLTPQSYQAFIAGSRGELSPVKHIYAALRTGWFSTRSVCYLAAGRPVIVQQTGFPDRLPVGEGVLPFESAEQAAAALLEVECDYRRHARAARDIAEAYFSADRVLPRFLEEALRPG